MWIIMYKREARSPIQCACKTHKHKSAALKEIENYGAYASAWVVYVEDPRL